MEELDDEGLITPGEIYKYLSLLTGQKDWVGIKMKSQKPLRQKKSSLNPDGLNTSIEAIENYEKGLRLYVMDVDAGVFLPAKSFRDENCSHSKYGSYWLMPRIADKIQERFDSLKELDLQMQKQMAEIEAKKLDLKERIGLLILQGHDHIL